MTAVLEGGEWSAARPGRTLPPFYKRLGGTQGRSGRAENLVSTGIRFRTVQPVVSRYTDWATGPTATCKTTPYYRRCWSPICISYGGMARQWPVLAAVGGVQRVRSTSAQWQEPPNSTSMPAVTTRIHVWSLRSSYWLLTTIRDKTASLLVLNKN